MRLNSSSLMSLSHYEKIFSKREKETWTFPIEKVSRFSQAKLKALAFFIDLPFVIPSVEALSQREHKLVVQRISDCEFTTVVFNGLTTKKDRNPRFNVRFNTNNQRWVDIGSWFISNDPKRTQESKLRLIDYLNENQSQFILKRYCADFKLDYLGVRTQILTQIESYESFGFVFVPKPLAARLSSKQVEWKRYCFLRWAESI